MFDTAVILFHYLKSYIVKENGMGLELNKSLYS